MPSFTDEQRLKANEFAKMFGFGMIQLGDMYKHILDIARKLDLDTGVSQTDFEEELSDAGD